METPKYFFQYRDDAQKLFLREYVYALGTFHIIGTMKSNFSSFCAAERTSAPEAVSISWKKTT